MKIQNCSALITGGASGMGAATARLLAKHGAHVIIMDTNQTAAETLASELHGSAIGCDITQAEQVEAAFTTIRKAASLRICINCAGILHARRMLNQQGVMPLADFRQVIEVNLIGTFNVMRLAAELIAEQAILPETEERGVMINTASVAAYEGQIGQTAYSASKGGIVSLTLPAARELARFGIRVMTIAPGLVDTPMFAKITPEARAALSAAVPFPKRLADPQEYAQLVLHIIENPMLNGEVIRLDGALRMM